MFLSTIYIKGSIRVLFDVVTSGEGVVDFGGEFHILQIGIAAGVEGEGGLHAPDGGIGGGWLHGVAGEAQAVDGAGVDDAGIEGAEGVVFDADVAVVAFAVFPGVGKLEHEGVYGQAVSPLCLCAKLHFPQFAPLRRTV